MAISKLALSQRLTVFLACMAIMPISVAGYIYSWSTISATDLNIDGSIEFADTIEFGDVVTDLSEIVAFNYSIGLSEGETDYGASFGIDDVYLEGAILVERAGLGSAKAKKKAKRKAKKKVAAAKAAEQKTAADDVYYVDGPISLDGDDGYVYFDVGSDLSWLIAEGYAFLSDLTPEPIDIDIGGDETKRKAKKKAAKRKAVRKAALTDIEGEWSVVGLPEPSSFVLLLTGFFMVGAAVRRRFGQS